CDHVIGTWRRSAWCTTYPLGVPRDVQSPQRPPPCGAMATFLIEIQMADARPREIERAIRLLATAQSRMRESAGVSDSNLVGFSRDDGRLLYLVEAESRDSAR